MRWIMFCGLMIWGIQAAVAQDTDSTGVDLENMLESAGESEDAQTQLLELLTELREHPLDVNTATAAELAQIPALGAALAQALVSYRAEYGLFGSLPEIKQVSGITEVLFIQARPYLSIGAKMEHTSAQKPETHPTFRQWSRGLRFNIMQRNSRRIELGSGYSKTEGSSYLGTPYRSVTRIRATYGRQVSFSLTADQDPGEPFVWKPAQQSFGYDFVSGHFALRNWGRLRALVVGDYVASFGQGVALWRGSGFGKSSESTHLIRRGAGIVPYQSTDENRFFRGIAATWAWTSNLSLTSFGSIRQRDATKSAPDAEEEDVLITSLYESGLHRTASEREKRLSLQETLGGGALEWKYKQGQVGILGYAVRFDQPFQINTEAYRFYAFSGKQTWLTSAWFHHNTTNVYQFGEVSRDGDGDWAGIGGALFRMTPLTEALVLYRHYPARFNSLYGYAFGERSGETNNETGFYLGFKTTINTHWQATAYFDQYHFPWLRYGIARPSSGYEALLNVLFRPQKWLSLYLQAKTETKEEAFKYTETGYAPLPGLMPQTRQSLRLHLAYSFSRDLQWRSRAEYTRFALASEHTKQGYLLYQEARWTASPVLQMDVRYALFQTDGYDARVYAYESDALYVLSNPSFSGSGERLYLLLRMAPTRALTFWLKGGLTRYEHIKAVGSGLDEVQGNRLREVNAQLQWRF